jgi:TonB family protein
MRALLYSAILVSLMQTGSGLAAEAKKPKGEMGSEWIDKKGNSRRAQMGLDLERERGVQPEIYRPVMFDWPAGDLQKGRYPGNIAKDEEGEVRVRVTVGLDGKLSACEISEKAKIEAFNQHVCPHLIRYARFIPALSENGERVSKSYDAWASYELAPRFYTYTASPPGAEVTIPIREASFVVPPTLAIAGIDSTTKRPPDASYIAAAIGVSAEGAVTGCTLHSPTKDDTLDKLICDSLKKNLSVRPAINLQTNQAVEGSLTVSLYWE